MIANVITGRIATTMDFSLLEVRAVFVRELVGKTARAMSAAVGLSSNMWGVLESGKKVDPRMSTPLRITERLEIELEWFARGRGPMLRPHPECPVRHDLDPSKDADHPAIREQLLLALERTKPARARKKRVSTRGDRGGSAQAPTKTHPRRTVLDAVG